MHRYILRSRWASSQSRQILVRRVIPVPSLSASFASLQHSAPMLYNTDLDHTNAMALTPPSRYFSSEIRIPKIKAVSGSSSPRTPAEQQPKQSRSKSPPTTSHQRRRREVSRLQRMRRNRLKERRVSEKKHQHIETLIRREPADFGALFDRLASQYPRDKIQEAVRRIQQEKNKSKERYLLAALFQLLRSTNPISGARLSVLEFLLSTDAAETTRSNSNASSSRNTTPPEEHVDIFVAARERGLINQLFWSPKDANEASSMSRTEREIVLQRRLNLHQDKTARQLQKEASLLVQDLYEILPRRVYRSVVSLFADYVASGSMDEDENENRKKRVFAMRKLSGNVEKRASLHFHMIAPLLPDFFYMNEGLSYNVVEGDRLFSSSKKKWDQARSNFVDSLMEVQDQLLECVEKNPDITIVASDASAEEEDAARESEQELQITQTLPQKKDRRYRKPAHMKFEAVPLRELSVDPAHIPRNTIFLDNLPIDMTEEEILNLYSRCGDVKSVEIYNTRPDLDPGPLSQSQTSARRKGKLTTANTRFRRWQRPRTPVYGIVTFSDEGGHRRALEDPLRIFGMVVRKHPIRSIDSSNMTSIFLEEIPEGVPCGDFEYQLCQQLHPDLFVCLDAGQNNRAIVGSCEIKFPSFEIAYASFHKLRVMDMVKLKTSECSVNWMRTPRNAEEWWTRALGFD